MVINTHVRALLFIIASISLAACGGSSGGAANNPALDSTEQKGQFIDSIVIGLRYETPTTSGFTDAQGRFSFRDGETVSFFVGDIFIGDTLGQNIVTPVELVNGAIDENNIQVQNIAMFLQTIDSDGDESNGITITNVASNAAISQSIDFTLAEGVFETNGTIALLINIITASNGVARIIIDRTIATNTLRSNLLGLFAGIYNGSFSGDDTGTWRVTIDNKGIISGVSVSDTSGSETVSGSISSNGQSVINGTSGTSVFSGSFTRSGNVSGTWLDDDGSSGTFTGALATIQPSPGSGVDSGNLSVSGNDASVIGTSFTPSIVPTVINDSVFNTGGVIVSWGQNIFANGGFESRSMLFTFNEISGALGTIGYLRITDIDTIPNNNPPSSTYSYSIDCEGDIPAPSCISISLDTTQKKVTFNNTALPNDSETDATAAIIMDGTLSW